MGIGQSFFRSLKQRLGTIWFFAGKRRKFPQIGDAAVVEIMYPNLDTPLHRPQLDVPDARHRRAGHTTKEILNTLSPLEGRYHESGIQVPHDVVSPNVRVLPRRAERGAAR
jgi:hypothetical protein